MMKLKNEEDVQSHVVIFPCPAQGHVTSMLKLAELLSLDTDIHVTFLNTDYIHNLLLRFGDVEALSSRYTRLQFKTISDCLPQEHHPGFGHRIAEVINSINSNCKDLLRDVLVSDYHGKPRVSCLIVDGIFGSLTTDLANELGNDDITLVHFRTVSACCIWAYLCVPKLFDCNELPITGDEDMDRIISNMPGMENLLRCRDLSSFCRACDRSGQHMLLDNVVFQTQQSLKSNALILNTFDDLEGPVLSQMRTHFPKLYTIGPLHHHLHIRKKLRESSLAQNPSFNTSVFEVDRTCMKWLDSQPRGSVLYVSFGSVTPMTRENLVEFWHGLINSKRRFLWVLRQEDREAVLHGDQVPEELVEGTKERGLLVSWAPQEEVLAHWAVGGFLTHSGWNSTLESVVAGVPMICWPYFADQQINSRFVSEVWKVGLDMKDVCHRSVVENMVNDVMVYRRDEFLRSAKELAVLAEKSVSEGGSSYANLDDLIQYIKSTARNYHE